MKRLLSLIIAATIMLMMFAACSGSGGIPPETQEYISELEQIILDAGLSLPSSASSDTDKSDDSVYSLVWFCDTQKYAQKYPDVLNRMTEWTLSQKDRLNIKYVLHTGDIIDDWDNDEQWKTAADAFSVFDGKIPLFVTAGNHDNNGSEQAYDAFLQYFGENRFSSMDTFGGAYEGGKCRYDLFSVGERNFILITAAYGMGSEGIAWMNTVLAEHRSSTAIIAIHSYIDENGEFTSGGQSLYSDVICTNPNVRLLLCGHRDGAYHTATQIDDNGDGKIDRTVHQVLFNQQQAEDGGGGYLMLITVDTTANTVTFISYSPYLDDYVYNDSNKDMESFSFPINF